MASIDKIIKIELDLKSTDVKVSNGKIEGSVEVDVDFDIEDYLDEADSTDLINELNNRGYYVAESMDEEEVLLECIAQNSNKQADQVGLIAKENIENLLKVIDNVNQHHFENFINIYS